jgi:hypothetical protein
MKRGSIRLGGAVHARARNPFIDLGPYPSDATAVILALARESTYKSEAGHHPARTTSQTCHVASREEFLECGQAFIDPR